jgi:hypothetical protein
MGNKKSIKKNIKKIVVDEMIDKKSIKIMRIADNK